METRLWTARILITPKRSGVVDDKLYSFENQLVFFQSYFEYVWIVNLINRTVPEKIPCNMRSLYRLAYKGLFPKKAHFGEQLDIKCSIIVGSSTYLEFQEVF